MMASIRVTVGVGDVAVAAYRREGGITHAAEGRGGSRVAAALQCNQAVKLLEDTLLRLRRGRI